MRIYFADLAAYNSGKLHGVWVDLDTVSDESDIQEQIDTMLRASPCPNTTCDCPDCEGEADVTDMMDSAYQPCDTCNGTGQVPTAEEWAVHDYDDFPDMGENPDLETVVIVAQGIEERGEPYRLWCEYESDNYDHDKFREEYQGEYRTLEDYAEDYCDQTGMLSECPDNLKNYIDYVAMAHDWKCGGDIWTIEGGKGYYVFSSCRN